MNEFSWLDIISLTLILLLAIKGLINGLVKEFFRLLGILGGIYFASRYAQMAGEMIDKQVLSLQNSSSLYLIGFLAIFFGFWIICLLLGNLFSKFASFSGLGFVNAIGGFVANGAKVFLVFATIFIVISHIEFIQTRIQKFTNKSFMYPIFMKVGSYIVNMKPKNLNLPNLNIDMTDKSSKSNQENRHEQVKQNASFEQNMSQAQEMLKNINIENVKKTMEFFDKNKTLNEIQKTLKGD